MKRPNIVIFNPDEMRWDSLSHMGINKASFTPNIDSFVREEAVSFSNAYCQSPVCVPSRCSFLTGLYPHTMGHRTMQYLLQKGEASLFSEFKENGYFVWMNDRNDFASGEIEGLLKSHADVIYSGKKNEMVMKSDHNRPLNPNLRGDKDSPLFYSHYIGELTTNSDSLNYTSDDSDIDECIREFSRPHEGKPLLAFLGLEYPHCPYGVEEPYFSLIDRKKLPPRAGKGKNKPLMETLIRAYSHTDKISEEEWNEIRAVYLGMCAKIDNQFKRLVDGLKREGVYDETLIIILSDHGDYTGDYSLCEKAQNTFEDCLVRVPLIIKPPKWEKVDPGITSSFAELVDFYATVFDYAYLTPSHDHFGLSLRSIVEDRERKVRDFVFSEGGRMEYEWQCDEYHAISGQYGYVDEGGEYWPKQYAQTNSTAHAKGTMIRDKRFKYIKRSNGYDEFYDMEKDIKEENNEIDNPLYKEEIIRMKDLMLSFYQNTCDIVPRKINNRIKRDRIEELISNLDEEKKRVILDSYSKGISGQPLFSLIEKVKKE